MVSEKFLQSAKQLPSNKVIGIQMNGCSDKLNHIIAFSDEDIRVTEEDYSWIFEDCATLTQKPKLSCDNSAKQHMKTYLVKLLANEEKETKTCFSQFALG